MFNRRPISVAVAFGLMTVVVGLVCLPLSQSAWPQERDTADAAQRVAVRKLLADAAPNGRLRLAAALALAREKDAVPFLIDAVGGWSGDYDAWRAERLLHWLAGADSPRRGLGDKSVPPEDYRAAWRAWWKEHGTMVDMARLEGAAYPKAHVFGARASSTYDYGARESARQAFDNLRDPKGAWWSSGHHPPGWIEADLGDRRDLGSILLMAAQNPPCATTHEIWLADEPIGDDRSRAKLVHTFKGQTQDGDVLTFHFPKEASGRYVQILTTESDSWVAWHKIELRVRPKQE